MIEIPVFQQKSADFIQEIELGNQLVFLRITWNVRIEFFFLSLTNSVGTTFESMKMVPYWPLFEEHQALTDFEGDFVVMAKTIKAGSEVTYDNLGVNYGLYYLTDTEVSEWREANGLG